MRYPLNTVPLNGYQRLYGSGKAAIALTASGFTAKQKTGVSTAALSEVLAAGAMKQAKKAASIANIRMFVSGGLKQAKPAYSTAAIIDLTVHYGIPDPKNIPAEFNPTHSSRVVKVQKQWREIDIYAESEFP